MGIPGALGTTAFKFCRVVNLASYMSVPDYQNTYVTCFEQLALAPEDRAALLPSFGLVTASPRSKNLPAAARDAEPTGSLPNIAAHPLR